MQIVQSWGTDFSYKLYYCHLNTIIKGFLICKWHLILSSAILSSASTYFYKKNQQLNLNKIQVVQSYGEE